MPGVITVTAHVPGQPPGIGWWMSVLSTLRCTAGLGSMGRSRWRQSFPWPELMPVQLPRSASKVLLRAGGSKIETDRWN